MSGVAFHPDDGAGVESSGAAFLAATPDVQIDRTATGTAVVELRGEYDLATRAGMHVLLGELVDANDLVVVDLSAARFVDSSFLHNLVQADRRARARGARFRVQLPPDAVAYRAFEVSGLVGALDMVADREQALAV